MKKLNEIINCDVDVEIEGIKINSKEIVPGDLFVCTMGVNTDRHDFIDEAIENGCSALIVKKECNYKVPYVLVDNPNDELGKISKKFYDNPVEKLKLIGITGTDGKTTTASIIRNMIGNDKCGYIGTNGIYIKDKIFDSGNTTQEINKTYQYLNEFVKNDLSYATMEISSEALYRNRTNTLELDIAVLTNITEDHLNVHKTMDNYIESKKKIFSLLKPNGVAIINRDDKNYDKIIDGVNCKKITFGKNKESNIVISNIKEEESLTYFDISYENNTYEIKSHLTGEYNVYNLTSAIASLLVLDFNIEDIIKSIDNIEKVYGRSEFLNYGQNYKIVLDYAHTPNGLDSILSYLNKIKKGKIITVTGSAGGREKEKRGRMGSIVLSKSDFVIFTMDDPRNEKVIDIVKDMISESSNDNYEIIEDREKAIFEAFNIAEENDIVLIAGKGRDNYMAIGDEKVEYCDYDVIYKYFNLGLDK